MAQLDNVKRITSEDFKAEDRDTVEKLGYILNDFMQQVVETVNGNLSYENFSQELKVIEVEVDVSGTPIVGTKIRTGLAKVAGIVVAKAENITNFTSFPTGTPLFSFSQNSNILNVHNITNLAINNRYKITILILGS